jgi:hypothetical protein
MHCPIRHLHRTVTTILKRPNNATITSLSSDLEFCCFSYGYTQPCVNCPFPSTQRPASLSSETLSKFVSKEATSDRHRACQLLGLDPLTLNNLTSNELSQTFRAVAFRLHPDTASEQNLINNDLDQSSEFQFQKAFEAFVLLRHYLLEK